MFYLLIQIGMVIPCFVGDQMLVLCFGGLRFSEEANCRDESVGSAQC